MELFANLIRKLDATNKTNQKLEAMVAYFNEAPEQDKVWAIALLSHKRPSRPVNTSLLKEFAAEQSNIPLWLFEESYHIVGDLAETIALVIPETESNQKKTLSFYMQDLIHLKSKDEDEKKQYVTNEWKKLNYYERFVFTKLFTGGFRIGVSQKLMTRALSKSTQIEEDILAYRLMGNWNPAEISFKQLVLEENKNEEYSKPYPFYLAYAIEKNLEDLGASTNWAIEHKWDGIRGQLIVRNKELFVWTRGEELATDKFPEFHSLINHIPDGTVLDGEILPFKNNKILSFNQLQTRIGRKNVSKKILENVPLVFKAYDLLEYHHEDIRSKSYLERRKHLESIFKNIATPILQKSSNQVFESWKQVEEEKAKARSYNSEGLMLKHIHSSYGVGRKKDDWWKWKLDPLTIDGVLTYAMRGHGRRSNLFTDYTFGVWQKNEDGNRELVTFAKAYSGLTDKEFREVDDFIKKNTLERFGPVRSVVPKLVFEIAFEGIALSKRHKSGVALRFPRILRWRKDKPIEEANSVEDLKALIP